MYTYVIIYTYIYVSMYVQKLIYIYSFCQYPHVSSQRHGRSPSRRAYPTASEQSVAPGSVTGVELELLTDNSRVLSTS